MTLEQELQPVIRPGWALPTDPREFRHWLRNYFSTDLLELDAPLSAKARAFLRLPAAAEMPPELRAAVERWAHGF